MAQWSAKWSRASAIFSGVGSKRFLRPLAPGGVATRRVCCPRNASSLVGFSRALKPWDLTNQYSARQYSGCYPQRLAPVGKRTNGRVNEPYGAGLPLLTCIGTTFAGRVAASLLEAVGLPELVTRTLSEYEALALQRQDPAEGTARSISGARAERRHPRLLRSVRGRTLGATRAR